LQYLAIALRLFSNLIARLSEYFGAMGVGEPSVACFMQLIAHGLSVDDIFLGDFGQFVFHC
jgi:hypothetical protein